MWLCNQHPWQPQRFNRIDHKYPLFYKWGNWDIACKMTAKFALDQWALEEANSGDTENLNFENYSPSPWQSAISSWSLRLGQVFPTHEKHIEAFTSKCSCWHHDSTLMILDIDFLLPSTTLVQPASYEELYFHKNMFHVYVDFLSAWCSFFSINLISYW